VIFVFEIEQWGLIGVFIAGAIPWIEAIAVVPTGIALGFNPIATVIAASVGNAITIFVFAYMSSNIRTFITNRRVLRGKSTESPKFEKALKAFDKYGIFGMAVLGPLIIGTQFAAAASVAAGVKPIRASIIITIATFLWATVIAVVMTAFGLSFEIL
jgi:hypothetical protein